VFLLLVNGGRRCILLCSLWLGVEEGMGKRGMIVAWLVWSGFLKIHDMDCVVVLNSYGGWQ